MSAAPVEVTALIHSGRRSLVYRARNTASGEMVLLKTLSEAIPLSEAVAQIKRELEVTSRLCREVAEVIGARGLVWVGDRPFITVEDIGGESLARIIHTSRLDIPTNLRSVSRTALRNMPAGTRRRPRPPMRPGARRASLPPCVNGTRRSSRWG